MYTTFLLQEWYELAHTTFFTDNDKKELLSPEEEYCEALQAQVTDNLNEETKTFLLK